MHHVRLTGLILFITTIFLGLAASATQTWTIKIKRPSWASGSGTNAEVPNPGGSVSSIEADLAASAEGHATTPSAADGSNSNDLQFVDVPVFQPLIFFGVLGLILWFVPAGVTAGLSPPKKRRRRKSRKRR